MHRIVQWLDTNLSKSLSPLGALVGIGLVIAGVGAGIALSAEMENLAIVLFIIFIAVLALLLLTAVRTDPTVGMTRAERRAAWSKTPRFLRISIYVLGAGPILDLLLDPTGFRFLPLAIGVSCIISARGMQFTRPPIPRPNQEPLHFESAPEQYVALARNIIAVEYLVGILFILQAFVGFWKSVP